MTAANGEMPHGLSRYTNWRCRCEVCRAAMATYMRKVRAKRATQPLPDHVDHGSVLAYSSYCCRCDACREAAAAHKRERVRADPEKAREYARAYYERTHVPAPPRPLPPHGSVTRYQYHRCRCDDCREAHARRQWLARQARKGQAPEGTPHGSVSTYRNWGCRCDDCRKAHADDLRRYKQARKRAAS